VDPLISKEDIISNNFHENNINKEKQNLDALRKQATPFRIKSGNFGQLLSSLKGMNVFNCSCALSIFFICF